MRISGMYQKGKNLLLTFEFFILIADALFYFHVVKLF